MEQFFLVNNLDCAHCAMTIEENVAKLDGVTDVSLNFALKKLTLTSDNLNIKAEIQKICDKLEEGIKIEDFEEKSDEDEETNEEKPNYLLLAIALFFEVTLFALSFLWKSDSFIKSIVVCSVAAFVTIICGYKIFINGIKGLLKFNFTESVLMTVAVIPAFCIGEYIEASMVTLLFSIGEIIEDLAVDKSRNAIKKLTNIQSDKATLITDKKNFAGETVVDAQNVAVGSIVLVAPYSRVPLDGVVVKGNSTMDTSALTGESLPVDISVDSEVLSGMMNLNGLIYVKTTKAFSESTATRILKLVEDAANKKSNREKVIARFAKIYTPIMIALAFVVAILPPLLNLGSWTTWLYRALICLVASCPCAIVISVPLAYFSYIGVCSKKGVLVKGAKYLDVLSALDTVVWDKTGTLTQGVLTVTEIKSFSSAYTESDILELSAALEKHSAHPIANAIKTKATNVVDIQMSEYVEIAGHGTQAIINGKTYKCGGLNFLDLQQQEQYRGYNVYLIEENLVIGAIKLSDTVRPEANDVIAELNKMGIKKNILLTGDNQTAADEILATLKLQNAYGNLLPQDKLTKLQEIKQYSENIAFVGDGINDSPVLAYSDCGIALGFGSDAAIESADVVLSAGTLSALPKVIKLAKKCIGIVSFNIAFALIVKLLVILLGIFGFAQMWMSVVADTGLCVLCCLLATRFSK